MTDEQLAQLRPCNKLTDIVKAVVLGHDPDGATILLVNTAANLFALTDADIARRKFDFPTYRDDAFTF